jgi:hypothetical protein
VKGEKIMNTITYLVTIVSLLLSLAAAGDASKSQVELSSPSAASGASSKPLTGCDDEFGCGTNHNETLARDAEPMK